MQKEKKYTSIRLTIYFAIVSYVLFGNSLTFNIGSRLPVKISELFSVFVIILFLINVVHTRIKTKTKEYGWVILWLVIGFFSAIINTVFVGYSFSSLAYGVLYSVRIIHILLYSMIILYFAKQIKLNPQKLINCMLISFALVCVIGLFQYVFFPVAADWYEVFYKIGVYWPTPDPHIGRLISTYFDPNYLSSILIIPIAIVLYRVIEGRNRFTNLFLAILYIVTLLLTKSRSGIVGLLIVLFGGLIYFSRVKRNAIYVLGALVILVPTFIILVSFSNITVFERIRSLAYDDSAMHRFDSWGDSFGIIGEYPIFGVGFNMYGSYMEKIYGETASASGYGMDSSILFAFVTTGIIGGVILLYGMFKIFFAKNNDGKMSVVKAILFASVLMSFFNNLLFNILWIFPFSILLLATNYEKEWSVTQ